MSDRPATSKRVGTALRAPVNQQRQATAASGGRIATALRGSTANRTTTAMRVGDGPGALNTQVVISNRPMTKGGINIPSTSSGRPQTSRVVQDESYFLGIIRTKQQELNSEISKMKKEIDERNEENSAYLSFEKKAEGLANQIKELQGQLADYNLMTEKMNTHVDVEQILSERSTIKSINDREAMEIDTIFEERRRKEQEIKQILSEIQAEKQRNESIVDDMQREEKAHYFQLKQQQQQLAESVSHQQNELETINNKLSLVQQELVRNPIKQQAMELWTEIRNLIAKNTTIKEEINNDKVTTPEQQKEKLIAQVKSDNQEIATMERRMIELNNKIQQGKDSIERYENDDDQLDGEKRTKYIELQKKEQEFAEFLDSFEETKAKELSEISACEANNIRLLENISRNIQKSTLLPSTTEDANNLKGDLTFKEMEMERSATTKEGLSSQRERMAKDLVNVNQLEDKISKEMEVLKEKIEKMNNELKTFNNLDKVKKKAEEEKQLLSEEKQKFQVRQERMNQAVTELNSDYEKLKNDLQENETYIQLTNLEKKWQHTAKNNFAIKDFIAQKEFETDSARYSKTVSVVVQQYNDYLKSSTKVTNSSKKPIRQ